jgi:hypothetical protein
MGTRGLSLFDDLVARVNATAISTQPLARLDAAIDVAAEATTVGDRLLGPRRRPGPAGRLFLDRYRRPARSQ